MLLDLISYLTTPCSVYLRNMGYLSETIDMRKRARGNRAAWQPHLDATAKFVLASAECCPKKGTVVILGSGLLLDLPIEELSQQFQHVILKDVICLPEVRKQIRHFSNITFRESDATGIAETLYRNGLQGIHELPKPVSVRPQDEQAADLIVSLNILSQLWIVPRAYVGQHLRGLPPDQVDEWCSRITEAHYNSVRALSGSVCLVADHAFIKRDRTDRILCKGSTIGTLLLPEPDTSWTWNIAPLTKRSPDLSKELIVGGWRF